MIESPCIRVCTLDKSGELCLGCFRTLEEIGAWLGVTRERVRQIQLGALEKLRRRAAGLAEPA